MTIETLEKANELAYKIDKCKLNLNKIRYTQIEGISIRESDFKFDGIKGSVVVPQSLFKTIGKLIESEYIKQIDKLEKELEEL